MEWMIKVNVSLILIALLGAFWERSDRRFQLQRFLTLLSIAIVLILPWLFELGVGIVRSAALPVIVLPAVEVTAVAPDVAESAVNFYLIGVVIAISVTLLKLIVLLRNYKKGENQTWSFFGVIRIDDRLEGEARRLAIEHESVHKRQWHSLDILFLEVLKAVFWFNPAVYIIKERLCRLHEYIADQEAGKGDLGLYKQTLIEEALTIPVGSLSNEFARQSTLLKRFEMMERNKKMRGFGLFSLVIALFGGILLITSCETNTADEASSDGEVMAEQIDSRPQYTGGMEQLMMDLSKSVVYPEAAKDAGLQGTVYVSFVVDENGELGQAEVIRGVDEQLDAAALKAVNDLPNDWMPGVSEGKAVAMEMKLPIRFALE